LSGTDAASFTLSTSNVLTFVEAPDFETKNSYAITLSVSDESETTSKDITILVVDTTAPVITVTGDNPATVELGATYTDAGATADGNETVTTTGTVDTDTVGSYTLTYSATDAAGNTGTATRTVNVVDTTAPVITVTGDNPATVELGATYTDAGATADGNETVTTTGTVDTDTVGSYTLTYSATDAAGNTGTATRTVNVVDTTAPVITVTGDNPATVELGATYTDAGATADGNETVTTTGTVDTDTVGSYTLTYSATDAAGNTGTATRTVNVVDTTAPVITVTGDNPATVELGATYTDAGATADGNETVTTTGTVDTDTVGSYTLTYSATDAAGNTGTATRTVNVVDTTAPVITVTGDNPATVELGATYTDAGATADGNETVTTTGTVDTDTVGSYTLTYSATDAAGNTGTATRTVNVVDTTAPVITVTGDNPATVELGATYTDAGATADGNETVTTTGTVDTDTVGSYTLTYSATDAAGNTGTATRTVNVVDTTAPVFTSSKTFSANENQTDIKTVTATDLQSITFEISGDELQISAEGVLSFVTAPDFETKSVFNATVTATDTSSNFSTQDITVNVTNVNEAPVVTNLLSSIGSEENQTSVFQVEAIDYEGDKIYYLLSGEDSSFFNISSSGLITFKTAPDFENPLDSGADNDYSINIIVTDTNNSVINPSLAKPLDQNFEQSSNNTQVEVINIDEDLIDLKFITSDGTNNNVPALSVELQIDELTKASAVEALIWLKDANQTWYTAQKLDNLNWKIDADLDRTAASGIYEIRKILIKRDSLDDLTIVDTALLEKGFDIDSIIYNITSDSNAPTLQSIDSITVTGNDGNQDTNIIITIVASVDDGLGEVEKVFSYIKGPGGETIGAWGELNDDKSIVTFTFTLDPNTASGTYIIDDIRLYDVAGNERFYVNSDLVSEKFTNSWNITNTIADNEAPTILSFSLQPSINSSDLNRKQITINLTTNEQTSPLNDIYIRLISPDSANIDQYIIDTGRLGTTSQNGNSFSHTISLPLEYPDGTYNVSYVFINDKALNNKRYEVSELKTLGFNTNVVFGSGNDHAPDISSTSSYSVAENKTAIGTVVASDEDEDNIIFSLTGTDSSLISIDSSSGALVFNSPPDYENDKRSYAVTISASDGVNASSIDITIDLTNVNDNAPQITSLKSFSALENQSSIDTIVASDADGDPLSFSITGSDINISSNGLLTFISNPDFEIQNLYTATVTVTDGLYETSQLITINITDAADTFAFSGKTIDGYIDGANVFVDQNFNFKLDTGELSSTTDSNGTFVLGTNDESLFNCLSSRPIIANVPVGAIDSTLGVVSNAYQMILPSINDTGSSSIVISPFSSLLSNAILEGKTNAGLKEDLTVAQGCSSEGDDVAAKVSESLEALYSEISTSFSIDKNSLLSDFILNPSSNISENIAQNIASLFPFTKQIDNQISDFLTLKYEKDIRANVALSQSALDIIFSSNNYDKLPLSFSSRYETERNSAGWYQTEELSASNGFISNNGILSREDCSETDTVGCNLADITLENIANTSTQYRKTSNFLNNSISISELKAGSLAVASNDSRSWRDGSVGWDVDNSRARECQSNDSIQFQITGNNKLLNFDYSSYSQGYMQFDCSSYRKYYYPKLNVSTIMDQSVNDNSIQVNYYIPDVIRSGIISNPPFDFVDNRLSIDPTNVIKEMATLPTFYSQLNTIRRKFVGEEYLLFEYHHDPYITYFEMGTFPRNDMYWDQETLGDNRLYGQDARDAFFEKLKSEVTFDNEVYGNSSPVNSNVLGRIAESYIEIVDYDANEQAITLPIYPTYDAATKTLDMSLINSELNLTNIQEFIKNGINGKPLTANIYYNPDDSISGTVPVALYLYKGNDTNLDANEAYFSIEFDLKVSSSKGAAENPISSTGIQTFEIEKDAVITAKYVENEVTIQRNIINLDSDKITLEDQMSGSSPIAQPATLEVKVLNLINKVSNSIGGIQSFFDEGGEYTYKLDLGTGGFSLVDFSRNTIDFIEGTFKVAASPIYAINVNDIIVTEGKTESLCFTRPSAGDLTSTSFNLSFT